MGICIYDNVQTTSKPSLKNKTCVPTMRSINLTRTGIYFHTLNIFFSNKIKYIITHSEIQLLTTCF